MKNEKLNNNKINLIHFHIDVCLFMLYNFQSGESIMVKVATGGSSSGSSSGEQIPMVFKVPRLGSSPMKVCGLPYSLLGFGDIIVPGNYNITVLTVYYFKKPIPKPRKVLSNMSFSLC